MGMPEKMGSSSSVDSKDEDRYSKCQGDRDWGIKASGMEGGSGARTWARKSPCLHFPPHCPHTHTPKPSSKDRGKDPAPTSSSRRLPAVPPAQPQVTGV